MQITVLFTVFLPRWLYEMMMVGFDGIVTFFGEEQEKEWQLRVPSHQVFLYILTSFLIYYITNEHNSTKNCPIDERLQLYPLNQHSSSSWSIFAVWPSMPNALWKTLLYTPLASISANWPSQMISWIPCSLSFMLHRSSDIAIPALFSQLNLL